MKSASMTGFGSSSFEWEGVEYYLEIKSLNSKSLDLQINTTTPWSSLDTVAYRTLQKHLIRGKITLLVRASPRPAVDIPPKEDVVEINSNVLEALRNQWDNLSAGLRKLHTEELFGRLVAAHPLIFKKPAVIEGAGGPQHPLKSLENNEAAMRIYQAALETAVRVCLNHRFAEGDAIAVALKQYLEKIRLEVEKIKQIDADKEPVIRKKIGDFWIEWNARLGREGAPSVSPDPMRLEQELLYYLEKRDIAEELVRLKQHLFFAFEILESQGEHGRKLGFIAQEIGRELNTIGSKSSDFEILRRVVLAKDVLEKIKEQSHNLL